MQKFSGKNSGAFSGGFYPGELKWTMGSGNASKNMRIMQNMQNTHRGQYRWSEYNWSDEHEQNPLPEMWYLTIRYPVGGTVELGTTRKPGHAHYYGDIAKNLDISKGQLVNITEKCGCMKRNELICARSEASIQKLVDELLPWTMAMKMRELG